MWGKRVRRVAILGCGPAGIFAAHAARELGLDVRIFTKEKRRSEMYGAQYLHGPIPGLTSKPAEIIRYILTGTPEEYAAKVYGADRPDFVSVSELAGSHLGWDIRDAYYAGFAMYHDLIEEVGPITYSTFTPQHTREHGSLYNAFCDARGTQVISTIPLPLICGLHAKHEFRARNIWAAGEAPERGQFLDQFQVEPNTVLCNGEKSPSWYRLSNVFGYKTCEWPWRDGMKPPFQSIAQVEKVVSTNCDCWRTDARIWRAGRNGAWDKRVLAHSAYSLTADMLRRVM